MNAVVREYKKEDVPAMRAIWNEVVAEGAAFPQMEELDPRQAEDFFANQSRCGVAEEPETGRVVGLYIPFAEISRKTTKFLIKAPYNRDKCPHTGRPSSGSLRESLPAVGTPTSRTAAGPGGFPLPRR